MPSLVTPQRIVLMLEYRGQNWSGWQIQPERPTLQQALEQALAAIAGVNITVTAAGRTDAGVHACMQVVHFDAPVKRPLQAWVRGVNSYLPESMAVWWAGEVAPEFHARFSALARSYDYWLLNHAVRPALMSQQVGWSHWPLDVACMHEAVQFLLGQHDFSAFRAVDCQANSPVKTVREAKVELVGGLVRFQITADAFLHHMVRNLMGSLLLIGSKRKPVDWLWHLLQAGDRSLAGPTFMPDGLYLSRVEYAAHWGLPSAPPPRFWGDRTLMDR